MSLLSAGTISITTRVFGIKPSTSHQNMYLLLLGNCVLVVLYLLEVFKGQCYILTDFRITVTFLSNLTALLTSSGAWVFNVAEQANQRIWLPNKLRSTPSRAYAVRKLLPHWDTRWASSRTTKPNCSLNNGFAAVGWNLGPVGRTGYWFCTQCNCTGIEK
jgi:hypothetical protein